MLRLDAGEGFGGGGVEVPEGPAYEGDDDDGDETADKAFGLEEIEDGVDSDGDAHESPDVEADAGPA